MNTHVCQELFCIAQCWHMMITGSEAFLKSISCTWSSTTLGCKVFQTDHAGHIENGQKPELAQK